MAKLEGVKTVDMVGGEITKISYDGAEYVRVDEEAKKGDIGVVKSDKIFSMNEGEFFRVLSGGEYRDNADCPRDANFPGLREEYDIFRKVSAQSTPTLAEVSDKVVAIEQRISTLEGDKLKVGDYVKPLPGASEYLITDEDMTLGKVDGEGGIFGDIRVEVIAHKTRMERIGEVYGVQSKYFRKATDEEIEEAIEPKFEEGDYARTLSRGQFSDISEGEVVSILNTEVGEDGDEYPVYAETPEGETDFFRPQDLEKLEGKDAERIEQFAKAGRAFEDKSEPIIPQEGDIVRVSNYAFNYGEPFKPGDIGIVVGADGSMIPSVEFNGHSLFAHVEVIARAKDRVDV